MLVCSFCFFFFFNDTATTEIYTLSLHDALPISLLGRQVLREVDEEGHHADRVHDREQRDRKSTRLNSGHQIISYAVFCLKKKKKKHKNISITQITKEATLSHGEVPL